MQRLSDRVHELEQERSRDRDVINILRKFDADLLRRVLYVGSQGVLAQDQQLWSAVKGFDEVRAKKKRMDRFGQSIKSSTSCWPARTLTATKMRMARRRSTWQRRGDSSLTSPESWLPSRCSPARRPWTPLIRRAIRRSTRHRGDKNIIRLKTSWITRMS